MVLELQIPPVDSKSDVFRTSHITASYKLTFKTYDVDFWCVRKLKCWVLQILLIIRERPGGTQGGSPKVEIRSLKQKKCIFWIKMAVSVVPAPLEPPDVVKKKVIGIFQKISQN